MSRVMCLALALASLTVPRGLQRFKHHMADLRHWLQKKRKFNHPRLLAKTTCIAGACLLTSARAFTSTYAKARILCQVCGMTLLTRFYGA